MSDKQSSTQLPSQEQISKCFDLILQSQLNWETFLLPVVEFVTVLSGLIYQAAGERDIKLNQGGAKGKSQFENPESLNSCLMKVCNQTLKSFQENRNSLEQTQLACEGIVGHVTVMGEGSARAQHFPQQLNSIKSCALQCKVNADSVVKELSDLTDLVSELLETSGASHSSSQDKLNEIRKILKENKESNDLVEKDMRDLDAEWTEVSQNRERLRNELGDVQSSAFIDELCLEGAKMLLPKVIDLLASPGNLLTELPNGLMFLCQLAGDLINKKSAEQNIEILGKVREKAAEKIQEVQHKLEESNRTYNEKVEQMKRLGSESETLLGKIKEKQTQESKVSTSLEMLTKGLGALGSLKTNWSAMINLIRTIAFITEDCQKAFDQFGAVGQDGPVMLATSQNQMSQAVSIISTIGAMTKTYVEIYDDHLKRPLQDMRPLLAGRGSSKLKFEQMQKKCLAATKAISHKVTENQEDFNKKATEAIGKLSALHEPRK
ncbi:uncharacterized protein LOC119976833 [Scyliorhinus canicula]|uniref:uncharacterized protein LOC119976833 n=1 Tax=Scyliorhinus canicula TaxID=7830 RepID=UPI0018F27B23|nr:uncharacterized protein LOC119976833 [Scyliorhinus canicula]